MAIYRGTTKLAGIGKGFSPENTGTEGQVLTKTNTGYAYQDAPENVKVFTLSSTSDLTNAQAAYDYYVGGGTPILSLGGGYYHLRSASSSVLGFFYLNARGNVGTNSTIWGRLGSIDLNISSSTVTSVTQKNNYIYIDEKAPGSGITNNRITLVV